MNLTAFTNQLSRVLTKRLSKAIMSNNTREVNSIQKLLDDPQGLEKKVEDIQKRYQQGDTFDQPGIDKELDQSFPNTKTELPGTDVVERLKQMGTNQTDNKFADTAGFPPEKLQNIQAHDSFKPEVVDVDDLAKKDTNLLEYFKVNKQSRPKPMDAEGKPVEAIVPPVINKNNIVEDGFNRIHEVKLLKDNGGDGKIEILRGSSVLKDNANNDVLNRIGSFAENLKIKIRKDKESVETKVGTNVGASLKDIANMPEKGSFIKSFAKATNNFDPEIVDDELYVAIAMDTLRAAKNNVGGRPGRKLTEVDPSGDTQISSAKNMNELAKDVGEAVSERIVSRGGSAIKDWEQRYLGSIILEFGRGNFGGKFSDTDLSIPHLFNEKQVYKDVAKGQPRDTKIIVTSDYFNNWYKTTGSGHGGRNWFDLYPVQRTAKAPSTKYHGPWKVDENNNVIQAPAGMEKTARIGGGKGDTTKTKDDLEILNQLGSQKMGVDPDKFEYWKHLGRLGALKEAGMDKPSLEIAIARSKLDEIDAGELRLYYDELKALKKKYNDREDRARIDKGEPPLTPLERENFGIGEHIRASIYKDFYLKTPKTKDSPAQITGQKIELDNSVGGFDSGNDNFLKALQTVSRDTSNLSELRTIQRAKFSRIEKEINQRFRMDPKGAEVYMPYMLDTRTRVYPVDSSGANLISGLGRFTFSAPRAKAKPITYNDESFYTLVDDLMRFEDNPLKPKFSKFSSTDSVIKNKKSIEKGLGKGGSGDLERHRYWKSVENQYLERSENLLKAIDKSTVAKNVAEKTKIWSKWYSKNPWLKNLKDQEPYLANLAEIGRIKRAYDGNPQKGSINETDYPKINGEYPKGAPHFSTHLVELDAPASGSQVLGAQYGDQELLKTVSVYSLKEGRAKGILTKEEQDMILEGVDNNAISKDLYMEVGGFYSTKYLKNMEELVQTDPQKAQIYTELSDKYIDVGRGTTKPIVMKVPYGAGMARLKKTMSALISGKDRIQIMRDYQGRVEDPTTLAKNFIDFHWNSMEKSLQESLKTQYEFRRFSSIVGKLYSELADGKVSRKPYMVKSPTGGETDFTVYATQSVQTYESVSLNQLPSFEPKRRNKGGFNKDGSRITGVGRTQAYTTSKIPMDPNDPETLKLVTPGLKDKDKSRNKQLEKMGINPNNVEAFAVDGKMVQEFPFAGNGSRTMASALAPNAVHQMDSSFLKKLVTALQSQGIVVYVVHDAFFVLTPDIKKTKYIAGKVFFDLHNNYNLREEMLKGLAKATNTPYETVLSRVDDIMANPTPQEELRGIRSYPDGSLRRKQEGPLGLKEVDYDGNKTGQIIGSPKDSPVYKSDNVIMGG